MHKGMIERRNNTHLNPSCKAKTKRVEQNLQKKKPHLFTMNTTVDSRSGVKSLRRDETEERFVRVARAGVCWSSAERN